MTSIRSERGQVMIEAVLIGFVAISLFMVVRDWAIKNDVVGNWTKAPQQKLGGMIESGVWDKAENARFKHPNTFNRFQSKQY